MENTAPPLDTPLDPSLDLFTRLEIALQERDDAADAFDLFKQDAIMAHPPETEEKPAVTSQDAADAAAEDVEEFDTEVTALLRAASDADLADAYRQSGGEIGDAVAEVLLGELRRRGLNV